MSSRLNDSRLFLLSSVPTKDDQQLNSAKLATYNEVLRSYISFREDCVRNSKLYIIYVIESYFYL